MDESYVNKIDNLAVKMDTQFGLHERYTDAFLQVAADIRLLVRQVESLHTSGDAAHREVYRELVDIAHELSDLEESVGSLKHDLKGQVDEYRQITERFTQELARSRDVLGPKLNEVSNAVGDAAAEQRVTCHKMVEQLNDLISSSHRTLEAVHTMQAVLGGIEPNDDDSRPLTLGMTRLMAALRRWRVFLWTLGIIGGTFGSLWGMWQALLQMGILQQQWMPGRK